MINLKNIRYPGLRNIKTALSILIIMIIYEITGNENAVMACIAAIICMQDSVNKTLDEGILRIIGTLFGGACGVLYTIFRLHESFYLIRYFWITIGTILIIYICNQVKKPEMVINTVIVFLVIVFKPDDLPVSPFLYSIQSIGVNISGIVVAVLVNRFFFPPKPENIALKRMINEKMKINYKIIKNETHKISKWSGGETTELMIFPENSIYSEKKFKWRISTATVVNEESKFTYMNNYYRHLMVLSGKVKLVHKEYHSVNLEPFDKDFFHGDWNTKSFGCCTDFNLMLRKGVVGNLSTTPVKEDMHLANLIKEGKWYITTIFYALEDYTTFIIKKDYKEYVYETLDKGDLIVFSSINQYDMDKLYNCSKKMIRVDIEI